MKYILFYITVISIMVTVCGADSLDWLLIPATLSCIILVCLCKKCISLKEFEKISGYNTVKYLLNEDQLMAKKEFKVGETFQCGLVKLKCIKSEASCFRCYFVNEDNCFSFSKIVGPCYHSEREDKTNVIFVKVEE